MKHLLNKKFWLVTVVLLVTLVIVVVRGRDIPPTKGLSATQSLSRLPPVMLWAWERSERLDFIDPEKVGVAFLVKRIQLSGDKVIARPRLQPLEVPPHTKLVAVVRIETDQENRPTLDAAQVEQTISELTSVVRDGVLGLQLDFDATVSERAFYRQLLVKLRRELPQSVPLSITALASWCSGDNWLDNLPVNEAVPMMFRLGVESRQFAERFQSGYEFPAQACRMSAGLSTDETVSLPPQVKRLYIFNRDPWSKRTLEKSLEAYYR
ncbi:MAG: hypothetical protein C5B55_01680 [Blastocatellia bacterium]|nr:MAG: hypothetical protein C5B55_01680 [Blastocatellia bacterium]